MYNFVYSYTYIYIQSDPFIPPLQMSVLIRADWDFNIVEQLNLYLQEKCNYLIVVRTV